MKTILSCKTLLYGGSAFSCGASLRDPQDTLIVEPGILLAPEFAATLAPVGLTEPHSSAGKELLRQAEERAAIRAKEIEAGAEAESVRQRQQAEARLKETAEFIVERVVKH